jgi:hypothetical protein
MVDGGNPTRPHRRRRRAPGPETRTLLERWQATLRAELADVLEELRPAPAPDGPVEFGGVIPRARPSLSERMRLVDLGVRIAHELGTELDAGERDAGPWSGLNKPERPRPRSRVEFGGEVPAAALADSPTGRRRR